MPDHRSRKETLGQGKWVRLVSDAGWEYAERTKTTGIAIVVAVTEDREILLVEQYRPAVGKTCLELPAGLAGDVPGSEDEALTAAARRELHEETGYTCREMTVLTAGPPSAGISSEVVTFLRATGLKRTGTGGGDASEEIVVHAIPLRSVKRWLTKREREGLLVAQNVWAGLYFARR